MQVARSLSASISVQLIRSFVEPSASACVWMRKNALAPYRKWTLVRQRQPLGRFLQKGKDVLRRLLIHMLSPTRVLSHLLTATDKQLSVRSCASRVRRHRPDQSRGWGQARRAGNGVSEVGQRSVLAAGTGGGVEARVSRVPVCVFGAAGRNSGGACRR